MLMARIFIGTMLTFGSVVVLGVMVLMASDIARLSSQGSPKAQHIAYAGHTR